MTEVILLSGGVESSALLYRERQRGSSLHALFIDYGQRAATREYAAAQAQCAGTGTALTRLDMGSVGHVFRAHQSHKLHVPLPHRNLVALSLGLSFAAQIGAAAVYLALNLEDGQGAYPSASGTFVERFQGLAAALGEIRVATPLVHLTKAEIIRAGAAEGIDFSNTYSCLLGYPVHCGQCPQCRKRRAAFAAAGVSEPGGFYRR